MRKLTAVAVIATFVSAAAATVPSSPVTYKVNRDTCVYAGNQAHVNLGARGHTRAGKGDDMSGEQPLVDWDMVAIQADIDAGLTLWGKTLQQAMDVDMIQVRYEVCAPDWQGDWPNKVVHLRTVLSVNDWWEGDGIAADTNYDWTTPYAATWCYAGDTVPFSSGAIEWREPGGTPGSNKYIRSMPGVTNTASFVGIYQSLDPGNIVWNSVPLDEAFWQELIYEDNCVGLRQYGDGWWPGVDANGNPIDPTRPTNDDNVVMYLREQWGTDAAPRLVIQVKPHDGDCQPDGAVNLSDLTIMANNWNQAGKQWEDGDFTGEGDVNLSDLTLMANEWNWVAGGAAAVPEPACLAVLTLGALAWVRRRR